MAYVHCSIIFWGFLRATVFDFCPSLQYSLMQLSWFKWWVMQLACMTGCCSSEAIVFAGHSALCVQYFFVWITLLGWFVCTYQLDSYCVFILCLYFVFPMYTFANFWFVLCLVRLGQLLVQIHLPCCPAFYCSMYFTLCFALRIKWWWI